MSYFYHQAPYQMEKPILKSVENIASTVPVSIDAVNVGLNKAARKVVPGGLWLASVNGVKRFLPRTSVTSAVSPGATQIPVDLQQVLKVGDSLRALEKKATITLGGTYVAGDVIYITYDNGSFAFKVTAPGTVGADLTNYINAAASFDARAVLNGGNVELYSVQGGPLTVVTNSAAGTASTTAYAGQGFLGTITAINYETSVVTIGTATTISLSAGAKIGVPVDQIYGFHIHSVDFTERPVCILNAIDGSDGVYSQSFPYLDSEIKARFPRINFA